MAQLSYMSSSIDGSDKLNHILKQIHMQHILYPHSWTASFPFGREGFNNIGLFLPGNEFVHYFLEFLSSCFILTKTIFDIRKCFLLHNQAPPSISQYYSLSFIALPIKSEVPQISHTAQNHNIMRKWCLSILKMMELSIKTKHLSMKKKRFAICLEPIKFLDEVLSF